MATLTAYPFPETGEEGKKSSPTRWSGTGSCHKTGSLGYFAVFYNGARRDFHNKAA